MVLIKKNTLVFTTDKERIKHSFYQYKWFKMHRENQKWRSFWNVCYSRFAERKNKTQRRLYKSSSINGSIFFFWYEITKKNKVGTMWRSFINVRRNGKTTISKIMFQTNRRYELINFAVFVQQMFLRFNVLFTIWCIFVCIEMVLNTKYY